MVEERTPPARPTTPIGPSAGLESSPPATTQAILDEGPFDAVLSAGVAGSLPGGGLDIGDVILAKRCVYAEEGLITERGFEGMKGPMLSCMTGMAKSALTLVPTKIKGCSVRTLVLVADAPLPVVAVSSSPLRYRVVVRIVT